MKMLTVIIGTLTASTLLAGSTVAVRAQTPDWSAWRSDTGITGLAYGTKCIRGAAGRGNGGKDTLYLRFRNTGSGAFDGWWSVSYDNSDPSVPKKNDSGQQKVVVGPNASAAGLNMAATDQNLCFRSPSVNIGPQPAAATPAP